MTRAAAVLAVILMIQGCAAGCGASDGWERVYNPLCRAAAAPHDLPPPGTD